jgi:hypothetical protein
MEMTGGWFINVLTTFGFYGDIMNDKTINNELLAG